MSLPTCPEPAEGKRLRNIIFRKPEYPFDKLRVRDVKLNLLPFICDNFFDVNIGKKHVHKHFIFYLVSGSFLLFEADEAHARSATKYSVCFNQAETYYEQIYCEIKVKDESVSLPSFIDFKKNDEQMQALLLKRKAEALNIPFTMPKNNNVLPKENIKVDAPTAKADSSGCQYLERTIKCHDSIFSIVGNKSNSELKPAALSGENKLGLDTFTGDRNDKIQVLDYLSKSYTRYIEKMLEIGLAGATMSFTKFYYIFQDLSHQGVDFQQRFETMYAYLKADKRSLGVTEAIKPIQDLTIAQCIRLNNNLFTCDNGTANRVYMR